MEILITIIVLSVVTCVLINKLKPEWITKVKTMIMKKIK